MSPNILGNVAKHSGQCRKTLWVMSPNINGDVAKHSLECPQLFWGLLPNISGNVLKHSGDCCKTFRGMSANIPRNSLKHSLLLINDLVKRQALKVNCRAPKFRTQFYQFIHCLQPIWQWLKNSSLMVKPYDTLCQGNHWYLYITVHALDVQFRYEITK